MQCLKFFKLRATYMYAANIYLGLNKGNLTRAGFEPTTYGLRCRSSTKVGGLPILSICLFRGASQKQYTVPCDCCVSRDHTQVSTAAFWLMFFLFVYRSKAPGYWTKPVH